MMYYLLPVTFISLPWIMPYVIWPLSRLFSFLQRQKLTYWIYTRYISPCIRSAMSRDIQSVFDFMISYADSKRHNSHLRVLEIGMGRGENFKYYPNDIYLTALDNNPECLIDYNENRRKFKHIVVERTLIEDAANMADVPSGIADVVVSTYVLCSVRDVLAVLKEIKRVMKPEGCLVFAEHTSYTNGDWKLLLQKVLSPVFLLLAGFRTDVDLERILKQEFRVLDRRISYSEDLAIPLRPHISGVAVNI